MSVFLEIKQCNKCPYLKTQHVYTGDSFDHGDEWLCTKTKRKNNRIAGFVEWTRDEPKEIPEWCPLKRKGK